MSSGGEDLLYSARTVLADTVVLKAEGAASNPSNTTVEAPNGGSKLQALLKDVS